MTKIISNPAQLECIDSLYQNFVSGVPAQILGWYTGSGKTHVFLSLAQRLLENNPSLKIGISAYLQTSIKEQTGQRAYSYFSPDLVEIVESGDTREKLSPITVFNPQSLYSHRSKEKFDLLFIDEAHAGFNDNTVMINSIRENLCAKDHQLLCASATPWDLMKDPQFNNCPVHLRGLHQGFAIDKRVSDFRMISERFDIEFNDDDFDLSGELKEEAQAREKEALKHLVKTKIETLISYRNQELGNKVLIIVPPGGNCMMVDYVLSFLKDQALPLTGKTSNESAIIREFINNPKRRFLVVVNKCGTGFDMPQLTSCINTTLTRNVKRLVQEVGRIARPWHDFPVKNYFYVFDKNRSINSVETLMNTTLQCACCDYTFVKGKVTLNEKSIISTRKDNDSVSFSLSEISNTLEGLSNPSMQTFCDIRFSTRRGYWTKERCLEDAKKYNSKKEWTKASPGFQGAYKYGKDFLDLCCVHMMVFSKPMGYWTKERCLENAKKYIIRSEWSKGSPAAYDAARSFGKPFYELCCSHMPKSKLGYWTKENCLEDAKKYKTRSEWSISSAGGYQTAKKYYGVAFFEECCAHMEQPKLKAWTKETILLDANQYKKRSAWRRSSSYAAALKIGKEFFEKCCAHMSHTHAHPRNFWTKERCLEDAKKYKTRNEWCQASKSGYTCSLKHGKDFFEKCCSHMGTKREKTWTKEICLEEAKKYKTRKDWNNSSASRAATRLFGKDFFEKCCAHMIQRLVWTHESCLADALNYDTKKEWQTNSTSYRAAKRFGRDIFEKCCSHMPYRSKTARLWTKQICIKDAQKYKTRTEWNKMSPGAVHAAIKYGKEFYEKCCEHMGKHAVYWTEERCFKDAQTYKTKAEWNKMSSGACHAAIKYGKEFYEKCCAHMNKRKLKTNLKKEN